MFGEPRIAASAKIDEIRQILEELPLDEDTLVEPDVRDDDEHEGLSVVDLEELGGEPALAPGGGAGAPGEKPRTITIR